MKNVGKSRQLGLSWHLMMHGDWLKSLMRTDRQSEKRWKSESRDTRSTRSLEEISKLCNVDTQLDHPRRQYKGGNDKKRRQDKKGFNYVHIGVIFVWFDEVPWMLLLLLWLFGPVGKHGRRVIIDSLKDVEVEKLSLLLAPPPPP